MVEATRLGTVFAYEIKPYREWRSSLAAASDGPGQRRQGLSGADLERAILALVYSHPDIVAVN